MHGDMQDSIAMCCACWYVGTVYAGVLPASVSIVVMCL